MQKVNYVGTIAGGYTNHLACKAYAGRSIDLWLLFCFFFAEAKKKIAPARKAQKPIYYTELKPEANFAIYPNPSNGQVQIINYYPNASNNNLQVQVYDATGKLINTVAINGNKHNQSLNLNLLVTGIYTIKFIQNNTVVFTDKLSIIK